MIFPIYIPNLTTVGPTVSEINCLIKMDADTTHTQRERDKQTDGNGRLLFRIVGVMKRWENIKVAIRPISANLSYCLASAYSNLSSIFNS